MDVIDEANLRLVKQAKNKDMEKNGTSMCPLGDLFVFAVIPTVHAYLLRSDCSVQYLRTIVRCVHTVPLWN